MRGSSSILSYAAIGILILLAVSVPVLAQGYKAEINRVNVGGTGNLDVDLDTPITVEVSHKSTLKSVTIRLYRSSTTYDAPNNRRDHYTITYYTNNNTTVTNPSISEGGVSIAEGIGPDERNGNVTLSVNLEDYAAPSQGVTTNTQVNNYVWQVDASILISKNKNKNQKFYNNTTTTEVPMKTGYNLNKTSLSTLGIPGQYTQFSPPIRLTNEGNVEHDLRYTATNLTSTATNDKITVENVIIDDDAELIENSETGIEESNYQSTMKTYNLNTPYNSNSVVYNWMKVPFGIDSVKYNGTFTYAAKESSAS